MIAPSLIPVAPGATGADYLPAADRARTAEHSSPRSFARRSNPLSRSRAYVDQLSGFPNSPSDDVDLDGALVTDDLGHRVAKRRRLDGIVNRFPEARRCYSKTSSGRTRFPTCVASIGSVLRFIARSLVFKANSCSRRCLRTAATPIPSARGPDAPSPVCAASARRR